MPTVIIDQADHRVRWITIRIGRCRAANLNPTLIIDVEEEAHRNTRRNPVGEAHDRPVVQIPACRIDKPKEAGAISSGKNPHGPVTAIGRGVVTHQCSAMTTYPPFITDLKSAKEMGLLIELQTALVGKEPAVTTVAGDHEVHLAVVVEIFRRHVHEPRIDSMGTVSHMSQIDRRFEGGAILFIVVEMESVTVVAVTGDEVEITIMVEVGNGRTTACVVADIRQELQRRECAVAIAAGVVKYAVVAGRNDVDLGTYDDIERLSVTQPLAVLDPHRDR